MAIKADLVIIGGGPAGMSAAVAAYDAGIRDIVILERDKSLGGILRQCIHNGFGLHRFKEELTGPEYAYRYEEQVREREIPFKLNTMVLDITPDKVVTATNTEDGIFMIQAKAIILAMGCRERPKGALNIAGTRPAGIYTAGGVDTHYVLDKKTNTWTIKEWNGFAPHHWNSFWTDGEYYYYVYTSTEIYRYIP